MSARPTSSFVAYALTTAGTGTAVLVRWLLDPLLGDFLPVTTLYGAVALGVWVGGYRTALLAMLLGYLACAWLFIEPRGVFGLDSARNWVGLALYLVSCSIIIGFGGVLHAGRRRSEAQQRALEQAIGQRQRAEQEQDRLLTDLRAERSRLEESLRSLAESERRYRTIGELIPYGVWMLDGQGEVLHLSDCLLAMLGQTFEECKKGWPTRIHPDDYDRIVGGFPRWLREAQPWEEEYRIRDRAGNYHTLLSRGVPLRGDDGQVLCWVGINLDLTRRKQAEEALRWTTEQLRIVTETMAASVTRCSRDLRYLWVSKPYADWIGQPADAIRGRPIIDVLGPEAFERLCPYFERVLAGEVVHYEERVPYPGIGPRWITAVYTPTRDARGAFDGWVGVVNDIEQHKQMEETLRESEQHSNADLQAMTRLQEVGSLCAAKDSDYPHCLAQILDAAIAFTGAEKGTLQLLDRESGGLELIAQRGFEESFVRCFATIHGTDATTCAVAMRTRARVIVEDVTQSHIFAGQRSLDMLLDTGVRAGQSTPLLSSANQLIGMVTTYFGRPHRPEGVTLRWMDLLSRLAADFLERRQAEEEVRQLNGELREAERRKDEFLATLAHELRNPLAPIRNALEVLRLTDGDGPLLEQARGLMERQLQRLVRLVDDLLDVSRITQGKVQLRKEWVQLAVVVANAIEAARPSLESHRHELTITLPPEPIVLDADPTRLAQVFANLLDNAAKYTDPGGHIALTAERRGREVVVGVRDTGIGIAPDYLPHVFEIFAQAAPALERSQGGLGIGLSLVRGLVELHGGHIEARSAGTGTGSEFVVYLPVADTSMQAVAEPPPANPEARLPVRHRILVADDNPDVVESLAMLFQLLGHEVQTARDGLEAVTAAATFRPELALLDIGMPRMNGYEAARRIRAQPGSQGIVLVALSGWGQEDDKRRAAEAGFDHHLTKPAAPQMLQQVLAMVHPSADGQAL